jgi:RNA polymerase sigma factor (sigma-70 family)
MIAKAIPADDRQEKFLQLLPQIRQQARLAFRNEPAERREDLVAEVIANCWVAYNRLIERDLHDVIYATPLAGYAVKQVRDGRRVGSSLNVKDVSSKYAQHRKGFVMESLDRYDRKHAEWKEVLVEDRHAGPAETAACRIDFAAWLRSLPKRSRRVAEMLAKGEPTKAVARRFHVSPGRISQLRRELMNHWQEFQGEAAPA